MIHLNKHMSSRIDGTIPIKRHQRRLAEILPELISIFGRTDKNMQHPFFRVLHIFYATKPFYCARFTRITILEV
jgi:hypothetical protein